MTMVYDSYGNKITDGCYIRIITEPQEIIHKVTYIPMLHQFGFYKPIGTDSFTFTSLPKSELIEIVNP